MIASSTGWEQSLGKQSLVLLVCFSDPFTTHFLSGTLVRAEKAELLN